MIDLFDTPEALANSAAELFMTQALKAVSANGRFSVLLAGGETPRLTYQQLAQEPYRSRVPWDSIHFFWGDERCVPAVDSRSNAGMARRVLLDHVPVRQEQIHPISGELSPQQAAEVYDEEIRQFFAGQQACFDLALLGLGDDGHTASLLPGSAALEEQQRWTDVTRRPEESFSRVTLTATIINQAAQVVFLVTGLGKAEVLRHILKGSTTTSYPAQLIRPLSGNLRWFMDRAAASMLEEDDISGLK